MYGKRIGANKSLVWIPEGKRLFERPRRRWERIDLRKIGQEGMNWVHLAQVMDIRQAVIMAVIMVRVPYSVGNFSAS